MTGVERCIELFENHKTVTWTQRLEKEKTEFRMRLLKFIDTLSQNNPPSLIETFPIPPNLFQRGGSSFSGKEMEKKREGAKDKKRGNKKISESLTAENIRSAYPGSDSSFLSILDGTNENVAQFLLKCRNSNMRKKGSQPRTDTSQKVSENAKQFQEDYSFDEDEGFLSDDSLLLSRNEHDPDCDSITDEEGDFSNHYAPKEKNNELERKKFSGKSKLSNRTRQDSDKVRSLQDAVQELQNQVGDRKIANIKRSVSSTGESALSPLKTPLSVRPVSLKSRRIPHYQFGNRRKKYFWSEEEVQNILEYSYIYFLPSFRRKISIFPLSQHNFNIRLTAC